MNKLSIVGRRAMLVFMAFAFVVFMPVKANAAVEDFIDAFAGNNIMFYNPDECGGSGSGTTISLNKDDLPKETVEYLDAAGVEEKAKQNLSAYEHGVDGKNIPWQVLAALHFREGGMNPSQSIADGEPLGTGISVDGQQIGATLEEDAVIAAGSIIEMGKSIYGGDISTDMNLENLANAFLAYNRGAMYRDAGATYDQSPYVMNGVDEAHLHMTWIHADSWYGSTNYNNLEGLQDGNLAGALAVFIYLGGSVDGSSSVGTANSDGKNVTIIGDSITNSAKNNYPGHGFDKYLTKADVLSQGSKHTFLHFDDNPSGENILKEQQSQGLVRDILVIALGTNDPDGLSVEDLKTRIVDVAKDTQKIVFVNNYDTLATTKYDTNNDSFNQLATQETKVVVADWKSVVEKDPSLVIDETTYAVHPTEAGADEFVKVIMDAIGADLYGEDDEGLCKCSANTGAVEGGLTEEQAQKLIDHYLDGTYDDDYNVVLRKDNCVNMSAFFVQVFTEAGKGGGSFPNGKDVAHYNADALDLEEGKEPRPFSIFSVTSGETVCDDGFLCGHTGIVVAVNGDDIITIEAAYKDPSFTGVKHRTKDYFVNDKYGDTFAYLEPILDLEKLAEAVDGMVDVGKGSKIIINGDWKDGWLQGGIEGYVKEWAVEAQHRDKIRIIGASHSKDFETQNEEGAAMANKITLHSSETAAATTGLDIYDKDDAKPAHFTVDMRTRKIYQHLPITKPADSDTKYNTTAGVQINIVGFSDKNSPGYEEEWDLTNGKSFGAAEWAYLATLIAAVANELEIEITSSVDWEEPTRLTPEEFKDYTGVIGHMHMPDDDHMDPGNVWVRLAEPLGVMTAGKDCNNSYNGPFPWYGQCDEAWANSPFGEADVCGAGCGPTSFAMMATALLHKKILPDEVAKYAGDNDMYVEGKGSRWTITKLLAEKYGLQYEDISMAENAPDAEVITKVSKYLREGWMIHTSGGGDNYGEPFTEGGHYIGIRGITSSGKWLIADSKGNGKENTLEKEWDPQEIMNAGIAKDNLKAIKK